MAKEQRGSAGQIAAHGVAKVPAHIAGLDEVLHGGLPAGRTTIVSGGAGSGKTVLTLEFLYRSALAGQPGIFVAFEESAEAIRQNAAALGWDLASLEADGKLFILDAVIDRRALLAGDFRVGGLLAIIEGKAREMNACCIVIDAVDVLMHIFDSMQRRRHELLDLLDWLHTSGLTAVLTAKRSRDAELDDLYYAAEYAVDCVVVLDQRVLGQVATRRLRVVKYRGSGFGSNEYPFLITADGIVIMPISGVRLSYPPSEGRLSSGNDRLDELLGGGYPRNNSILITGTSGTGKTTLACTFARQACKQGQKVLYLSFEESPEALVATMQSPGIDLRPAIEAATLEFLTAMPESMGAESHLLGLLRQMDRFRPDHLIVDAISATRRMGGEQAAFDYLMRLVDACRQRGVTCIMTNQLDKDERPGGDLSGMGCSSLIDTIVLLTFVEQLESEVARSLLILKSRGTNHSHHYHLYHITDGGIRLTDMPNTACREGGRR